MFGNWFCIEELLDIVFCWELVIIVCILFVVLFYCLFLLFFKILGDIRYEMLKFKIVILVIG